MSTFDEHDDERDELADDEGGGSGRGGPLSPEEQVEDARRRALERRYFGEACKRMMALLSVTGLAATFDDANRWVKLFERPAGWPDEPRPFDVTAAAAEWIDAGWHEVETVEVALTIAGSVREAERILGAAGVTRDEAIERGALIDILDGGLRRK